MGIKSFVRIVGKAKSINMNRKTFFGTLFGLGLIGSLKAAVKEQVGKIVKDYAKDTLQVRRIEIVDEKGAVCGFIEERESKMVIGAPKKEEPVRQVEVITDFRYQEPDPSITFIQ